ncbi:hypothetical protein C4D60_Mb10t09000 [Musa balbisiana]|uniref:AAA+ ATPase domain-containing protein n=1 Tax=Musa balbisiana TaxID=52838 RepID=A0A4S8IY87_MUSBA|nr:hypothetical protein C4D60_Mb10t09000 [Musa balbisiana]
MAQEVKMFFGWGKETKKDDAVVESTPAHTNGSFANGRKADLAVYEQFEQQVGFVVFNPLPAEAGHDLTATMTNCRNERLGHGRESFRTQRDQILSAEATDVKWESIKGLDNAKRLLKEAVVMPIKDIIRGSPDVKWESIKGLDNAKRLLKEAVVMPIKYPKQRPLLPPFESAEVRTLAETLCRDIIRGSPDVKWESIKGLDNAKRLLKEAVVMPIKYPKYTMLAKAVATECKTTFFNISASSIVSKWRGDSEKLVRVLFELARHHAPATIFLDEIDAIISQRGEARSEHEASRRLKTELLIQMDGLTKTNELVFVLAATNLPWELDAAMLRRLEKRILVPLPEPEARQAMFEELLPSVPAKAEVPYDYLVEKTEGYSGSDIRLVCKEAAMQPLRRLMSYLEDQQQQQQHQDKKIHDDELPPVGPVTPEDIEVALKNTRPSAHLHAHRYHKFNEDYGSHVLH